MPGPERLTTERIRTALAQVRDPELGLDIVSLGLIYAVDVIGRRAAITMTLTTPGCPLVPYFQRDIESKVKKATGAEGVDITLTFDPPWSPAKMTPSAQQQLTMLRG